MKSYSHLWERFVSDENYYLAVGNATKHKSGKKRKCRQARYIKEHADELKDEFIFYATHFENSEHKPKMIYDGVRRKQRQILVPTINEQVIHHMVANILQPIFMKSMYEHSYGSIPGRGAHGAKKTLEKWIRSGGKNFKYILKLDIKKYFDSIPHDILKQKLTKIIHDERFLTLMFKIVDVNDKGIPIGFYTSQWIANWYLTELDHYIKEELKAKYYIRYMDDMVIAGPNKRELHRMKNKIEDYLNDKLGLRLKENWQVYKFDYHGKGRDIDFMGFRFYRDHTTLRRSILLKATRKARKIKKNGTNIHSCRQMLSYLGWLDCTDTYGAYIKWVKPFVSFRALRRYESRWQIKHNKGEKEHVV